MKELVLQMENARRGLRELRKQTSGFRSLLQKIFGLQHRHDKIVETVLELFQIKHKVLDLGAREGAITQKLFEKGFDVTAVDINREKIKYRDFPWIIADLNQKLPQLEDESFHLVTASNLIEYLEDQFGFLRECYRVLKKDGTMLIETPNILNLQSRMSYFLTGFQRLSGRPYDEVSNGSFGERRWNLKSYFQLRAMLHRNGFQVTAVTTHEFSNKAMLLFPFLYLPICLLTYRPMRREENSDQRKRNEETFRHAMSLNMLLGKQLIIVARKKPAYDKTTQTENLAPDEQLYWPDEEKQYSMN